MPALGQAYVAVGGGVAVLGTGLSVTGYQLSTGKQLWQTALDAPLGTEIISVRAWPGVITVGLLAPDGRARTEFVLNATTGNPMRHYPAAVFGGAVAASKSATVIVGPATVTSYNNATGRVRWQRKTPAGESWQVDGPTLYLAEAGGSAQVTALGVIGGAAEAGAVEAGTVEAGAAEASAAEDTGDLVNLASDARTQHILDGHMPPGEAGNTLFPGDWSAAKIMNAVSDVATDPANEWIQQTGRAGAEFTRAGDPVRFVVNGVYDGLKIRVILEPGGEGIACPRHAGRLEQGPAERPCHPPYRPRRRRLPRRPSACAGGGA